jgi:hypothetical protein
MCVIHKVLVGPGSECPPVDGTNNVRPEIAAIEFWNFIKRVTWFAETNEHEAITLGAMVLFGTRLYDTAAIKRRNMSDCSIRSVAPTVVRANQLVVGNPPQGKRSAAVNADVFKALSGGVESGIPNCA